MAYCVKIPLVSDVHVYFHRMGHYVCEGCCTHMSRGGMIQHLKRHHNKVPPDVIDRLVNEQQDNNWR